MLVARVDAGWGLDVLLAWGDAGLDLCNVEQGAGQEKDCEATVLGQGLHADQLADPVCDRS